MYYTSSSDYGSVVSSSTKYYRSSPSPYLSYVSFVPNSSYSGTVTLSYTAFNIDGDTYSGTIKITVGDGDMADAITYITDSNTPVTLDDKRF